MYKLGFSYQEWLTITFMSFQRKLSSGMHMVVSVCGWMWDASPSSREDLVEMVKARWQKILDYECIISTRETTWKRLWSAEETALKIGRSGMVEDPETWVKCGQASQVATNEMMVFLWWIHFTGIRNEREKEWRMLLILFNFARHLGRQTET